MNLSLILFFLTPFAVSSPVERKRKEIFYIVEYEGNHTYCDEMEIIKWSSGFHDCFFKRKYGDGGQNLETIVDRILEHSEDCVLTSIRLCQPNFQGFKDIMSKVIYQMKDYTEMYLGEIYKGREKMKDLECVEKVLTIETYAECFKAVFQNQTVSENDYKETVNEGFDCASAANDGCSREAKISLNRIVGNILGQPYEEKIADIKPVDPPPPPPKRWYDYIIQPFVSAWHFIRSLFG